MCVVSIFAFSRSDLFYCCCTPFLYFHGGQELIKISTGKYLNTFSSKRLSSSDTAGRIVTLFIREVLHFCLQSEI